MLIIKLETDGNSSTFGADGADVCLIAKMSGSFLRQSEQTSLTHTRTYTQAQVFEEGRLFSIHRTCKSVSKAPALIKVCEEKNRFRFLVFS